MILDPASRSILAGVLLAAVCLVGGTAARAQSDSTAPTIVLDRYELAPDDQVVVQISGFRATSVAVAVCGNRAARGASDCAIVSSKGFALTDGRRSGEMTVAAPPTTCPCVVRAWAADNNEVAIAPITLVGHPIGPVVGSGIATPLDVTVVARPASASFVEQVRSGLAGGTTYDVTIIVRNPGALTARSVSLVGAAVRGDDELAAFDIVDPGDVEPGGRFEDVVAVEVPAPSWGTVEWRVNASSNQPTVVATSSTTNVPWLLWVFGVVLALDIAFLAVRNLVRLLRRRRRDDGLELTERDVELLLEHEPHQPAR